MGAMGVAQVVEHMPWMYKILGFISGTTSPPIPALLLWLWQPRSTCGCGTSKMPERISHCVSHVAIGMQFFSLLGVFWVFPESTLSYYQLTRSCGWMLRPENVVLVRSLVLSCLGDSSAHLVTLREPPPSARDRAIVRCFSGSLEYV